MPPPPKAAQAVRQALHAAGQAARATDTPAPTQGKAQTAEPAVEKHVMLSPRANARLTRLIQEHRQAKEAKAKTANAQNYIHLIARGHFARDGKYRPATTYHIGVKTNPGKPAPPTRYEYGRALPRDGKTTGGFKHVAKQMEPGGWLLLEANDPSANLAGAVTVHSDELRDLPAIITTDFVDTNRFDTNRFDTDGLVRPHRLRNLIQTPGYMPTARNRSGLGRGLHSERGVRNTCAMGASVSCKSSCGARTRLWLSLKLR